MFRNWASTARGESWDSETTSVGWVGATQPSKSLQKCWVTWGESSLLSETHEIAAIHWQVGASDIAGIIRCEKYDRAGYVAWRA